MNKKIDEMRFLNKIGYTAGITFLLVSLIRYLFNFPDLDRLIAYTAIGCLILGFSWFFDRISHLNEKVSQIETKFFDFEGWVRDKLENGDDNGN